MSFEKFTINHLFVNGESLLLPYDPKERKGAYNVHWGQRKLLFSEIEFLTLFWDPVKIPNPIVIYPGAAPGNHIPFLADLFPGVIFYLYDIRPFAFKENDRLKIFQQFFYDKDAEKYKGRDDVFFVSDIRKYGRDHFHINVAKDLGISVDKVEEIDKNDPVSDIHDRVDEYYIESVFEEMKMQETWVKIINPLYSLLKFKIPYPIRNEEKNFPYLKGLLLFQAWARNNSPELRLVSFRDPITGKHEMGSWNNVEYEQMAYYHNRYIRNIVTYENPLNPLKILPDMPELLNDYDSIAEIFLLKLYFQKFGLTEKDNLEDKVLSLSKYITYILNRESSDNVSINSIRNSEFRTVRLINQEPQENKKNTFKKKVIIKTNTSKKKSSRRTNKVELDISKFENESIFIDE